MRELVAVDPFRCRMWDMHDRLEASVTEERCRSELESFAKYGQLVPALGRKIAGDPDFDVELIYGARRLFVARQLNTPLIVELRRLTDKEAIVAMDIENRHRTDISPYERGVSYVTWLRAGYFGSQEEIARALKVSPSQVSRLLKLAVLPAVVINAFSDPTEICEGWGLRIAEVLEKSDVRDRVLSMARGLAAGEKRHPAEEVYRKLLSVAGRGRRISKTVHDEVVKDPQGVPLFRIRHQRASLAVIVPLERISKSDLDRIRDAMFQVLNGRMTIRSHTEERSSTPLTSAIVRPALHVSAHAQAAIEADRLNATAAIENGI